MLKLFFDQIGSDYGIVATIELPPDFPFNETENFDDAVQALVRELNAALGAERVSRLYTGYTDDDDDNGGPGADLLEALDGSIDIDIDGGEG